MGNYWQGAGNAYSISTEQAHEGSKALKNVVCAGACAGGSLLETPQV